jgi:hypothetical protein
VQEQDSSGDGRPGASNEVQGGFRRESSSAIRAKDARGSDMCRCNAARPKRAGDQQRKKEEDLCRATTYKAAARNA